MKNVLFSLCALCLLPGVLLARDVRLEYSTYLGGGGTDSPVPADYTGNSADSIAIFRPATGLWAVRNVTRVYFGGSGDQAATR